MKIFIKIFVVIFTILAFIPLIWFCGLVIAQAINEVDYLAVVVLSILTLSLIVMCGIIVYGSLTGE